MRVVKNQLDRLLDTRLVSLARFSIRQGNSSELRGKFHINIFKDSVDLAI
jgi:hypothetical protein